MNTSETFEYLQIGMKIRIISGPTSGFFTIISKDHHQINLDNDSKIVIITTTGSRVWNDKIFSLFHTAPNTNEGCSVQEIRVNGKSIYFDDLVAGKYERNDKESKSTL